MRAKNPTLAAQADPILYQQSVQCAEADIDFKFDDGSVLEQAYEWLLWTLPEIREVLRLIAGPTSTCNQTVIEPSHTTISF